MGSIPLPALDIKPPQQPDMLGSFQKLMALRGMGQQQQLQQSQLQGEQQKNEMGALQLQDQQNLRALSPQFIQKDDTGKVQGFDYNGFANAAASKGVSPQTVNAIVNSHAEAVKNLAGADEATRN